MSGNRLKACYDLAAAEHNTYVVFGSLTALTAHEIFLPHKASDYRLIEQELLDWFKGEVRLDDCMIVTARDKQEAKAIALETPFARSSYLHAIQPSTPG